MSPVPTAGDPIHLRTGNTFLNESDYQGSGPFPLRFSRHYNSHAKVKPGSLGKHWRSSYDRRVRAQAGTLTEVYRANGIVNSYQLVAGVWTPAPDITDRLEEVIDGLGIRTGWRYITGNDTVESYDADGRLVSITSRAGLSQTLAYDITVANGGDDNPATLDSITDPFGRTLRFSYDASGRIATMTDPAEGVYGYSYDANGNLVSISYPDATPSDNSDNPTVLYHYENTSFVHAITGKTDENGNRLTTWGYDTSGRAIFSENAGGAERVDIVYNSDGTTTVADSLGNTRTYHFQIQHGVVKLTQIDGGPCPDCGGAYQNVSYDANGFLSSRTDFNGNTTTFVHNARGLETSRTEAAGTLEARTITTEWHADFRVPIKITEPGKITTFSYDSQGRLLERKEEAVQ